MTQKDYHRFTSQMEASMQVLRECHKTIDNIIQQMEARTKEYRQ